MKNLFLFVIFSFLAVSLNAQNELAENQHHGEIHFTNGNIQKGIIEADFGSPWAIQKGIKYFDESLLSQPKIKNKDKADYDPKDIVWLTIGDRIYEVQKYADLTAAGTGSIPHNYFLERITDGKIKLFKFYQTPMMVGNTYDVDKSYVDCRNNPDILIWKEGEKIKAIQNIDLREYLADCPAVLTKYENGEYGNPKVDPEKSKFAAKVHTDASIQEMKQWIVAVIDDYNQTMK
jgi:hypothetical protein